MECMQVLGFYLIMSHPEEEKHLLQKITKGLSRIKRGLQEKITLAISMQKRLGHA